MSEATEPTKQQMDEQRIARTVAIGLPVATIVAAIVVALVVGPATSILVLAAGGLLGVIAILWSSIRILSGDAPLPPDLEELDMRSGDGGGDALLSRKKMLLRALKDLDNERAIGKLDTDDYEPIAIQYRNELKTVLAKIDDQLAPNRALAEAAAKEHLAKVGIGTSYRSLPGGSPADEEKPVLEVKAAPVDFVDRIECPKCNATNEPDAKFCKECATKLISETKNENADA